MGTAADQDQGVPCQDEIRHPDSCVHLPVGWWMWMVQSTLDGVLVSVCTGRACTVRILRTAPPYCRHVSNRLPSFALGQCVAFAEKSGVGWQPADMADLVDLADLALVVWPTT